MYGNPVNLVDPSGHCPDCDITPQGERLFQGPVDWIATTSIVTAWPFFAASQGLTVEHHLGRSIKIVGGLEPEISYGRRGITSFTSKWRLTSGTTEVPGYRSTKVPTRFAKWASTTGNGLLAIGAVINTYDILDRYYRLGEINRQQAGYQLLTNAGFTFAYAYGVGPGAAWVVAHYTAGATAVGSLGMTTLVGVGVAILTFDLMVLQGAINNWSEGQSGSEGLWNARDATLDSLGKIVGKDHKDWDNRLRSLGIR